MRKKTILTIALCLILFVGCGKKQFESEITVTKPLDVDRKNDTVSISWDALISMIPQIDAKRIELIDPAKNYSIPSQPIDLNGDNSPDELVFQVDIEANDIKTYLLKSGAKSSACSDTIAFSKYQPGGTDDFNL